MCDPRSDVTELLRGWADGDRGALDRLIPLLYDRLHELAHRRLRVHAIEPSLNTTGLVHEAYLKLVDSPGGSFANRHHFLAIAARVMRNVLVDHARARFAAKRGGGAPTVELTDDLWISQVEPGAVLELDAALKRLEALDPRQSVIVERHYFGGLTLEETAATLDLSLATIKRELRSARAWLANELDHEAAV